MSKVKLMVLALLMVFSTPLYAQNGNVFTLNTIQTDETGKAKGGEKSEIFFEVNEEIFTDPGLKAGAEIDFYINSDNPVRLVVSKVKEYLPGTVSVIATHKGNKDRVFTATYTNGRLKGLYHPTYEKAIKIGYESDLNQHYLSENERHDLLSCGVHNLDNRFITGFHNSTNENELRAKNADGGFNYSPAPVSASVDDNITIDLMLVYSNAAETWALTSEEGDIAGVMAQAMALSQAALDNSDVGIELRLVHTHKTGYDEENDGLEDSDDRLSRLTQNPNNPVFDSSEGHDGFMEDVHDLRLQYGADVVSLLLKIDDTGGLGWRLANTNGSPHYAFNLNRVQQVANGYTLIHEIGHNMGNAHSRTQAEAKSQSTGGLFHYSTGYQNTTSNFHTVMAYADGLQEAPIFSSPDLTFNGAATGTNNNQTPENNARSMREIKRTISSYLPSIEDAPLASISDNSITVEMNREENFPVNFQISNNGSSSLVWDVDFKFPGNTVGKQKSANKNTGDRIQGISSEKPKGLPANYSGRLIRAKNNTQEQVLYATSFEGNEGFGTGNFTAISDWRTFGSSEFHISSSNPNSGSQHLRLEYDGATNDEGSSLSQWIYAPFFGYQPFGSYEVSLSFEVGGPNVADQLFDFYLYDGKTGGFSAGAIIGSGTIFFADLDEQNDLTFRSFGTPVPANTYHTLRIVYNNLDETIDYYLNGNQLASNSYIDGVTPGELVVLHRNTVNGTFIHVDNIEIKRLASPYLWLSVQDGSGVTSEGENSNVSLNFSTVGVSAGTYESVMTVRTNDPNNRDFEVPVNLVVNDVVSNEPENIPQKIALAQNYPNPFNPSTVISFQLAENSEVQLEVFDMAGRKLATLADGKKAAGDHTIQFDGSSLSSGVYVYRLKTPNQTLTRKMVLIK